VELRAARIPVIGWFAWHHWLVIERSGVRSRWEVWQTAGAGGQAWGHLHRDLLPPDVGVGRGPSWIVQQWQGEAGDELAWRIEASPVEYPFRERYRYWPGPNSNTYVQWILGCRWNLSWKGCGRGFLRREFLSPIDPTVPNAGPPRGPSASE
jgi:hypothetical protein